MVVDACRSNLRAASLKPPPPATQALASRGVRSVVFDTGEHGPGGRLATRSTADQSLRRAWLPSEGLADANMMFDHAAQYFTVDDDRWERDEEQ